jgi:opacity protein-like surface antigen
VKRLVAAAMVAALAALMVAALAPARPLPSAKKCRIFPRSSHWNQRVDKLPVLANSNAMVAAVGASRSSHADFGSGLYNGGPIGIPYTTVSKSQKRVHVSFDYSDESDKGPYPIPANVPI